MEELGGIDKNIQTTLVLSARANIVEFKVDALGAYALVEHSIYRVAKAAIGHLVLEGDKNPEVIRQGE
jgi:nitrite reductase (NO-forming)